MNFKRYKRLLIFFGICGCIFAHPSPVTLIVNTTTEVNGLDTAFVFNKTYANNEAFKKTSFATVNGQLLHKKPNSQGIILPNAAIQNVRLFFNASEEAMLP